MARRLEKAGFAIQAVLGDYQGGPWDERADVWVILAQEAVDADLRLWIYADRV